MITFQDFISHPYSIPPLISSLYFITLGIFIFSKNWRREANISFLIVSCSSAIWLFSYAVCFTRDTEAEAIFWSRNAYFGINYLAVAFYHWVVSMLDLKRQKKFVYAGYIAMVLFTPVTRMNFFLGGVKKYFWGYYPYVGSWVYTVFVAAFSFIVTYAVWLSFTTYIRVKDSGESPLTIQKIKYVFASYGIMTLAMVDYIAKYKIPVYPFGYIFVWSYLTLIAYTIIRYRLFEIDTVIHRTLLWLLTILILIMPVGLIHSLLRVQMSRLNSAWIIIIDIMVLITFLGYYNRLRPKIDHLFRRRKYDYYQILSEIGEKIGTELDINNVITRLFKELKEVVYIRNGLILVQQLGQQDYTEAGSTGYDKLQDTSKRQTGGVLYTSNLSQWLNVHQKALEREQIEIDPQYEPIKEQALTWVNQNMLELLIPIIMEDKVNGLIGIGKKENLQAYTAKDIELLEKMGRQLGVTIDNALHHEDIVEKERLDEELKLGREIQMNLLPRQIPQVPYLSLQGLMNPAKEIGGDYYDFITLPNKEELAIVIGDVSGKGVAAGLLMSMVKATIHAFSQEGVSPKQILLRTNAFLHQNIGGQKFMTLLYLKWQSQSHTLIYSSAGHEHILICRCQSEQIEAIQSGGFMLGMIPDIEKFLEERQIRLEPRDKILLYTDGVTEAENASGGRFGLERLKESFQRHSQKPANELMQSVKDEVYAFIGSHPQYDDITLVVMEAK